MTGVGDLRVLERNFDPWAGDELPRCSLSSLVITRYCASSHEPDTVFRPVFILQCIFRSTCWRALAED